MDLEGLGVAKVCCHHLGRHEDALRYGQQVLVLKDRAAGHSPGSDAAWSPSQARRRVIAYSVWGTRAAHLLGAAITIQLARRHFDGWEVLVYAASTIGDATLALYRRLGAEVRLADLEYPEVPTYFWRFLVADNPTVLQYLCRDADCRLGFEEAELVREWPGGGQVFHIVRPRTTRRFDACGLLGRHSDRQAEDVGAHG